MKFRAVAASLAAAFAMAAGHAAPLAVAHTDPWTDLRAAVYYNQEAEVVRLLDSGVDINMQNSDGWTVLHVAAEQGMLRMVQYLLARGADPNIRTTRGRTAFDVAAGYPSVQAELKKHMAPEVDPFADVLGPNGQGGTARPAGPAPTPGGAACSTGSRNGADGRSAAMRPRLEARDAVWYNNPGDLVALLDCGLNVNMLDDGGETLLHAAAWRDRVEIARILLARGADPSIRDRDGKLPADYAQSPEMRALLGTPRAGQSRRPAPPNADDHCRRMWQEATALCGIGNTGCNTSAHVRYQSCQRTGTWY